MGKLQIILRDRTFYVVKELAFLKNFKDDCQTKVSIDFTRVLLKRIRQTNLILFKHLNIQ